MGLMQQFTEADMASFTILGQSVEIPAVSLSQWDTGDRSAWQQGKYLTVRVTAPCVALRAHTNARSFAGRPGSRLEGTWMAIGDVIQTSIEFANSRSLPTNDPTGMTAFTHVAEAHIDVGCVLNIGLASAKFGGSGGGFQAEYVAGPKPRFQQLSNIWHGRAATA
jgi:hypothetical protein